MPRCWIKKEVIINGQRVDAFSPAVLLRYNDRYTVVDPENDNVLIDGITPSFLCLMKDKGYIIVEET